MSLNSRWEHAHCGRSRLDVEFLQTYKLAKLMTFTSAGSLGLMLITKCYHALSVSRQQDPSSEDRLHKIWW